MIQIEEVSKEYGSHTVLEKIDFTLGNREKCALVGRNGSGKTTIFRLIAGQEEPDSGQIILSKHYRIGYLNQHIHFTKPTILAEACLGLKEDTELFKAEAILQGLGFQSEQFELSPSILSGGYALRLHLAALLLSEPDCLLLDEPTNYLDIVSIGWLTQFLKNWPRELITISHDRHFLDSISTHTMAVHRKKVRKVEGSTEKLYEQIAQEESIYEKTREALDKKKKHMQLFIDRFGAKNTKAAQAQSKQKAIAKMPALEALQLLEDLDFEFPAKQTASKIILKASDIHFSYGDSPLIQGLNLEVTKDARIGIIGKNGKGKSTLLKLLTGELQSKSGSFQPINDLTIGYFGQSHIERLDTRASIDEEIQKANPLLSMQQVRKLAGKMQFPKEKAEKKISVLSGGEKSRVVLAKLLATPCHILLLDEPTNHLDIESMESFMEAVEEFQGACIIVSHSEHVLERLCQTLIIFHEDRQEVFQGSYQEFLEKGGWQQDEESKQQKKETSSKNDRQLRAERVQERSRAIRPYQKQIETLENKIITLEAEIIQLTQTLTTSAFSAETAKSLKEKQTLVDNLFAQLETTHEKLNNTLSEFS